MKTPATKALPGSGAGSTRLITTNSILTRLTKRQKTSLRTSLAKLQPAIGSTMIDVGCGTGRHSKYLAAKGFQVTGIDLASSNIKEVKKSENVLLRFYCHDMRMPFGKENFDYVSNFFTSFGYFKHECEHTGFWNICPKHSGQAACLC